ncbi:hypothetical protein BDW02DRAFT_505090 [Decorospora gaudefroyi]|uniref:Ubiquitin-like domain-containing protein n=1 Tax=Decorospora gaudefroyi TaxID=184978 RepID=A0A6A5K578_9PLEO|nr:hypothetical protein BDW02DRAFT_505090 [Decorospora gaudefroyi]
MSAVENPKPVDQPEAGTAEPAPTPVVASDNAAAPVETAKTEEVPKTEGETVAPAEEKEEKVEKVVEPIYSGALGYKAPGLKNAFRFSKKYFWFGEEPVPSDNLREYLRGEKPEVAHPVVAWSSQTGKGLLFFVKHADQKENPAGVLNLAYATDLHKDGAVTFALKISGHKHTFEAQSAHERDGWFVAVEKAVTEAKGAKEGIESSEGYKEYKEKLGKPTVAGAVFATPKKSTDATPKLGETETTVVAGEPATAAPARAGSASSSSSGEEKKKKAKSKSRSVSRGKRTSLFGGLLGKKDKEHKEEGEAVKTEPEVKQESSVVPHLDEIPTTAAVNTNDVIKPSEETKTEPEVPIEVPVVVAPATEEPTKVDETPAPMVQEKPKPAKRGSIFGQFVEKLKSPTTEKKEHEAGLAAAPVKEDEPVPEASKPLQEASVVPVATETPVAEPVTKTDEAKPVAAVSTPSKEKEHFSFGKLFGSKDRAKSPAATDKVHEPKVDAAPKIEDTPAPVAAEPVAPVEAAPLSAETKTEPVQEETPKPAKRASFFGNLSRSLSKAAGGNKEKKNTATSPAPVVEEESTSAAPVLDDKKEEQKDETAPVSASGEQAIADVPAEAVSVGEAPKSSNPTVATTAVDSTPVRALSSSHNITAPSTRPSSIPSPRASHASQGNAHQSRSRPDADDRPNTPLKPIPAAQRSRLPNTLASSTPKRVKPLTDSTNLTWTRSRLEKERADWWDTQVTGSEEIWGAIRLAAQYLQTGELQEAQTMLDVTGCTCPTGLLWRGVYDQRGVQYKVPEWVVVEPEGLAEATHMDDEAAPGLASASVLKETMPDSEDDAAGGLVRVRVRMSHNQKDVFVEMQRNDTVAVIVEKLRKQAKLESSAKIRLAYGGRIYHDHETIESHPHWNFGNNFILSALVFL